MTSLAALRAALEQARYRHAKLWVVHVRRRIRPRATGSAFDRPPTWAPTSDEVRAADSRSLGLIDRCLVNGLGVIPDDVDLGRMVLVGRPSVVLADLGWRDSDLLVVGTHGGRRWRHPRRRSVSRYCVGHCVCPVLSVRGDSHARATRFRLGSQRPRLPRNLWREFDATAKGASAAKPVRRHTA